MKPLQCAFCGRVIPDDDLIPGRSFVALTGDIVCSERCAHRFCARDTNGAHRPGADGACTACGFARSKMGEPVTITFCRARPSEQDSADCGARIGDMSIWPEGGKIIVFFPTKRHWREPSRLIDIAAGLADLGRVAVELRFMSIAIPALGCGEGGLSWEDVRPLIETTGDVLAEEGIEVEIYPPHPRGRR